MSPIDYGPEDIIEAERLGAVRVERRWSTDTGSGFDGEEVHEVAGEYIARVRDGRPSRVWGLDEDVLGVLVPSAVPQLESK